MAEYIDRDKVLAFQNELEPVLVYGQPACYSATKDADLVAFINDIPAADVAEVVRCMNCGYSEPWYAGKSRCFLWHESGIDVFNDGFCNYGKKRGVGNG